MTAPITVTEAPLDSAGVRSAALDPRAGAVVLFEGCARDHHAGRAVDQLAYEAFVPMAEAELGRIRDEATARFGLVRCLIHHRLGEVPLLAALARALAHRPAVESPPADSAEERDAEIPPSLHPNTAGPNRAECDHE